MKQRRAFLFIVGVMVILAAIWIYILFVAPSRETLDQRVHDVASQLKCPVCQDESVADSPSTISLQMRGIIRNQLQEGQSEQQIIQYFVSRYGSSILWSPPKQGFTLLAWIIPIVMLFGGAILLLLVMRGWLAAGRVAKRAADAEDRDPPDEQQLDPDDLQQFQARLELELAADDPLFAHLDYRNMTMNGDARTRAGASPAPTLTNRRPRFVSRFVYGRGRACPRPGNAGNGGEEVGL